MIVEESKELESLGAYEVVGPNGEYYGRYAERPSADKIPLYAMVRNLGDLGQEKEILGFGKTAVTVAGLAGTAVQGIIAYLLLANSGKWNQPWKGVGYVGGGLFILGALGSLIFVVLGRGMIGIAEKVVEEKAAPASIPAPGSTLVPAGIPAPIKNATDVIVDSDGNLTFPSYEDLMKAVR